MANVSHPSRRAFISYVREDAHFISRMQRTLAAAGIEVWRDTADLRPGEDWRIAIRRAITGDALAFIACFSQASARKDRSYQREELILAIEQLRLRNPDNPWLIPVRLDECQIPDRDIGGGRLLTSLQHVDLFGDHYAEGMASLVAAVLRIFSNAPASAHAPTPPREANRVRAWLAPGRADQAGHSGADRRPVRSPSATAPVIQAHYMNYETARVEGVVFDLSNKTGGLIVYCKSDQRGKQIEVWVNKDIKQTVVAKVVQRTINGKPEFAAVFPSLPTGTHGLYLHGQITIFAGQVAEADLR